MASPLPCPKCSAIQHSHKGIEFSMKDDGHTYATQTGIEPEAGSVTVCGACAAVLVFVDAGGQLALEEITPETFSTLPVGIMNRLIFLRDLVMHRIASMN